MNSCARYRILLYSKFILDAWNSTGVPEDPDVLCVAISKPSAGRKSEPSVSTCCLSSVRVRTGSPERSARLAPTRLRQKADRCAACVNRLRSWAFCFAGRPTPGFDQGQLNDGLEHLPWNDVQK